MGVCYMASCGYGEPADLPGIPIAKASANPANHGGIGIPPRELHNTPCIKPHSRKTATSTSTWPSG